MALFRRDLQRAAAFLRGRRQLLGKATEAFVEIHYLLTDGGTKCRIELVKKLFEDGRSLYWHPDFAFVASTYFSGDANFFRSATNDTEGAVRRSAFRYLAKRKESILETWT